MDPKGGQGGQGGQDTRRNELVAEEVAEEGRGSELVVVAAAAVALDQAVIHIDMEKNCMTGKNYSEKVIVELGVVVERLDKVMYVAVAVEQYCMTNYYHHRKIEDYSANTVVAEAERPAYLSCS